MMKTKAVFVGCYHICTKLNGDNSPHVGGDTDSGAEKVWIEGQAACRVGDTLICNSKEKDEIETGSKNKVYIENKLAAVQFGQTKHGGKVIGGANKVFIG